MNFNTFFSSLFLVAMTMLALDHHPRPVMGFELRHLAFSNTTKNRLMMPLRLDDMVLTSRRAVGKGSDGDVPPSSPRGIVLNTAVGGLTFAGGLIGFVTKGSKASLTAGSIFGGLLMLSAVIISKSSGRNTASAKGNILGFSVSGMLGFVMGKKFLASKKFMPAGLLASLSASAVVYNLIEAKIVYNSHIMDDEKKDSSSSTVEVDESGISTD